MQELLFRETDHRATNSLQFIASLIGLQSRRTAHQSARQAIDALGDRVAAVSLAHCHV